MNWAPPQNIDSINSINSFLKKTSDANSNKLKNFTEILYQFSQYYSSIDELKNLSILELGPGKKENLAHFLEENNINISCVGLPKYKKTKIKNYYFDDINTFLKSKNNNSIDLIYSRYVLEENSFSPLSLLFSKNFMRLLQNGPTPEVVEKLPGSREYIKKTYSLIEKKLKKGGLIINLVVDRKKAYIPSSKEEKKKFKILKMETINPRRGIIIVQKLLS